MTNFYSAFWNLDICNNFQYKSAG